MIMREKKRGDRQRDTETQTERVKETEIVNLERQKVREDKNQLYCISMKFCPFFYSELSTKARLLGHLVFTLS